MREASRLGALGHSRRPAAFQAGASEFEIELAFLRACGLREQELPYNPIIALNEGGAVLHYQMLETTIAAAAAFLLIDAGAEFAGYASDITRTYSLSRCGLRALIQQHGRDAADTVRGHARGCRLARRASARAPTDCNVVTRRRHNFMQSPRKPLRPAFRAFFCRTASVICWDCRCMTSADSCRPGRRRHSAAAGPSVPAAHARAAGRLRGDHGARDLFQRAVVECSARLTRAAASINWWRVDAAAQIRRHPHRGQSRGHRHRLREPDPRRFHGCSRPGCAS